MKKLLIILLLLLPKLAFARYVGDTIEIPCDRGGLNHSKNLSNMPNTAMVHPSRNLDFFDGIYTKRGGTALVYSTVFTDTPEVRGVFDYRLINGNQFTIACTADGKVYKDNATTIKTGMSTTNWFDFAVYDDKLYIVDGTTVPQIWNGSDAATSSIASVPAEWTGNNYPQWIVVHGSALTERLWAGGCPNYPNTIYYSANGTDNFLGTGSGQIYIETESDVGIVGAVEYGDRLLVFSKNKSYVILDSSSDINNWNYAPAQWAGGVANHRLIVKTPNDIVLMNDNGDIASIRTVEKYGDYEAASLTRTSYMDSWIREHIDLSLVDDFHAIYDPKIRAIKLFVIRKASTTINTALVYYIDRKPEEGWIIHDNQDNDSGYSAVSAGVFRVNNEYIVQTGDYDGRVWELESEIKKDNDQAFWAGWKTPKMDLGQPRNDKDFNSLVLIATAIGSHNLSMNWWVDEKVQTAKTISMSGTAETFCNDWAFCVSAWGGCELIDEVLNLGVKGGWIQFEFYNSTAGQDFKIHKVLLDAKIGHTRYN